MADSPPRRGYRRNRPLPATATSEDTTPVLPSRADFLANLSLATVTTPVTCLICHNDEASDIARLSCHDNHEFCTECITEWLQTPGVNACPACRTVLFTIESDEEIPWDPHALMVRTPLAFSELMQQFEDHRIEGEPQSGLNFLVDEVLGPWPARDGAEPDRLDRLIAMDVGNPFPQFRRYSVGSHPIDLEWIEMTVEDFEEERDLPLPTL